MSELWGLKRVMQCQHPKGRRAAPFVVAAALTLFINAGAAPSAEAAFPGRNGRIAFSAGLYVDPVGRFPGAAQVRDYDIFTISPTGSGLQQVTEGDYTDMLPAWSPDGRRIAFARADASSLFEFDIYVVDAQGGAPVNLTQAPQYRDWEPAWSPDGTKIVFRSDRAAPEVATRPLFDAWEGDLFVMDADGSNVVQITSGPGFELMPSWSPDGEWIAFSDVRAGSIGLIRPDGSGRRLLPTTGSAYAPEWSPDGTRIAYVGIREDQDVLVIDLKNNRTRNLTNDAPTDRWPVWSPDGKYISFVSRRDDTWALYRMNADGTHVIRLVDLELPGDAPLDWGRRP